MHLSEEEVRKRLQDLRNLEMLHGKARDRVKNLEQENKQLKEKIRTLEEENNLLKSNMERVSFQLEQIKNKVFGKKPDKERIVLKREREERDASSYQRPIPQHITETKTHPINACVHCNQPLTKKRTHVFFEEDIPLPIEHVVIRHEVEVGYCKSCKRQTSGCIIPSKKTVLGEHVKKYVCLLSITNRLPHAQIKEHLKDVFGLELSLGEISNMLHEESDLLRPAYERLKVSLMEQEAVHYDETTWKVQKEEKGKFAWVATGTENNDTVFTMGQSRGKGNVEDLGVARIGITDDYGAYKNAFKEHQLCWAHPQRKLRDVAESNEITKERRIVCINTYIRFSKLYKRIVQARGQPLSAYLKRTFQKEFDSLCSSHALDPTPLAKIKESLRKNKDKYFTFLAHPTIPIDNNKAERSLWHMVIKRKISFGSKTQRGAETTSILASVILSLKWNDPDHWFEKYLALKA